MSDKLKNTWKTIKTTINKAAENVGSGMNTSAKTGFNYYLDISKKGLKIKKQNPPKDFKGY